VGGDRSTLVTRRRDEKIKAAVERSTFTTARLMSNSYKIPQRAPDCAAADQKKGAIIEPKCRLERNPSAIWRQAEKVMRVSRATSALALAFFGLIAQANATVRIHIDLTAQHMNVESFCGRYTWPVSTARSGYSTPQGSYAPTGMQRMHYSRKYHMSPMPYSIFFKGGYAIHGSYDTRSLGRPASHGCVRLDPAHAAFLFKMVEDEGATISITGAPPASTHYAGDHRRHRRYAGWRSHRYRYWTGGFFPFLFWR
jgi:lipoprotein-anchoring transpeptidase ErfK/SrfK